MLEIYIDDDACPVRREILRVAERHALPVHIVSNRGGRPTGDPRVRHVLVADTPDAADDWIAENIASGDVAITGDIPLAARCLDRGASVLGHDGRPFTEASIGMALATRDLMAHLRETGEASGGGRPFSKQDRARFLDALEAAIQRLKKLAGR